MKINVNTNKGESLCGMKRAGHNVSNFLLNQICSIRADKLDPTFPTFLT